MTVILLAGATGLLGPYLADAAAAHGKVVTLARKAADVCCDLTDPAATASAVARVRPDMMINAAAMTDVDACERDPAAADKINHLAAAHLADAVSADCILLGFSTIAVYPDTPGPHKEAAVGPANVYGRSKLAGERATLRHARSLVVRAAMFGASRNRNRRSLSDFIIDRLSKREPLSLFADEKFSPLHVATLAGLSLRAATGGVTGVYNAATRDGLTKAEFGLAIAARLGLPTETITICNSRSVPGRSRRALDMRLDPGRFERALGVKMPSIGEEIAKL